MDKVSYLVDNRTLEIKGYYWRVVGGWGIILLHMMPATKESWIALAERLNAAGYQVLAIDLRGHGESLFRHNGRGSVVLDYKKFTDEDHQASIRDVYGARDFLIARGLKLENIAIGGASIGANLALQYLAETPAAPAAFLLSPGLNYKGIQTLPLAEKISQWQKVFIVAARDDIRALGRADQQAKEIYDRLAGQKELKIFDTSGHGTELFATNPELTDNIIDWLKQ